MEEEIFNFFTFFFSSSREKIAQEEKNGILPESPPDISKLIKYPQKYYLYLQCLVQMEEKEQLFFAQENLNASFFPFQFSLALLHILIWRSNFNKMEILLHLLQASRKYNNNSIAEIAKNLAKFIMKPAESTTGPAINEFELNTFVHDQIFNQSDNMEIVQSINDIFVLQLSYLVRSGDVSTLSEEFKLIINKTVQLGKEIGPSEVLFYEDNIFWKSFYSKLVESSSKNILVAYLQPFYTIREVESKDPTLGFEVLATKKELYHFLARQDSSHIDTIKTKKDSVMDKRKPEYPADNEFFDLYVRFLFPNRDRDAPDFRPSPLQIYNQMLAIDDTNKVLSLASHGVSRHFDDAFVPSVLLTSFHREVKKTFNSLTSLSSEDFLRKVVSLSIWCPREVISSLYSGIISSSPNHQDIYFSILLKFLPLNRYICARHEMPYFFHLFRDTMATISSHAKARTLKLDHWSKLQKLALFLKRSILSNIYSDVIGLFQFCILPFLPNPRNDSKEGAFDCKSQEVAIWSKFLSCLFSDPESQSSNIFYLISKSPQFLDLVDALVHWVILVLNCYDQVECKYEISIKEEEQLIDIMKFLKCYLCSSKVPCIVSEFPELDVRIRLILYNNLQSFAGTSTTGLICIDKSMGIKGSISYEELTQGIFELIWGSILFPFDHYYFSTLKTILSKVGELLSEYQLDVSLHAYVQSICCNILPYLSPSHYGIFMEKLVVNFVTLFYSSPNIFLTIPFSNPLVKYFYQIEEDEKIAVQSMVFVSRLWITTSTSGIGKLENNCCRMDCIRNVVDSIRNILQLKSATFMLLLQIFRTSCAFLTQLTRASSNTQQQVAVLVLEIPKLIQEKIPKSLSKDERRNYTIFIECCIQSIPQKQIGVNLWDKFGVFIEDG